MDYNFNIYKQEIELQVKPILYYAYLNDLSFPRSCGIVSNLLTYYLHSKIKSSFYIHYIRGIFKNVEFLLYNDDFWCEDVNDNIDRFNFKNLECNCHCCGCCEYMNPHSWVEIINKKDLKTTILDFTQIQFQEYFSDYQDTLISKNKMSILELFEYLDKHSTFYITEENPIFKYYIPIDKKISSEKMVKYVEDKNSNSYNGMVKNFKNWKEEFFN